MSCEIVDLPPTAAPVDIVTADNASFADAFQFGDSTDTSWDFNTKTFRLDVKGNPEDITFLLSIVSGAGAIVVDNPVLRVLHFNVPFATLVAALSPGVYVYDFIMTDAASVRTILMQGSFTLTHGITGS